MSRVNKAKKFLQKLLLNQHENWMLSQMQNLIKTEPVTTKGQQLISRKSKMSLILQVKGLLSLIHSFKA